MPSAEASRVCRCPGGLFLFCQGAAIKTGHAGGRRDADQRGSSLRQPRARRGEQGIGGSCPPLQQAAISILLLSPETLTTSSASSIVATHGFEAHGSRPDSEAEDGRTAFFPLRATDHRRPTRGTGMAVGIPTERTSAAPDALASERLRIQLRMPTSRPSLRDLVAVHKMPTEPNRRIRPPAASPATGAVPSHAIVELPPPC